MPDTGMFAWNELGTTDPDRARQFFGNLLGWKSAEMPMAMGGTYTMFKHRGKDVGGMYRMREGQPGAPMWMPYVAVGNVDQAVAKVAALGGQIMMPPTDIPNVGRFATIADPTGAAISLITFVRRRPAPAKKKPKSAAKAKLSTKAKAKASTRAKAKAKPRKTQAKRRTRQISTTRSKRSSSSSDVGTTRRARASRSKRGR